MENCENAGAGYSSVAGRVPVLMVRHGRGRTGGTTFADFVIQRARLAGRQVLIGDGDRRNASLAGLYPPGSAGGASQPASDETPDVKEWLRNLVAQMATAQSSLVLDLGAGDQALAETCRELDLAAFCESAGIRALSIYTIGPDLEDFDHVLAIHRSGVFKSAAILVMNAHLAPVGRTARRAFDGVMERPDFSELGEHRVTMNRFTYMDEIRRGGLGVYEVAAGKRGKNGNAVNPLCQFAAKVWTDSLEHELEDAGVEGWLP